MPNPDLVPLLVDTATRRRLSQAVVAGQTRHTHVDVAGIRCAARPSSADTKRAGYGMVPESDFLVSFHPDADVEGPRAADGERDVLILTAGKYAGLVLDVGFVHQRVHVPMRKAECTRLPALPTSTAAP